jgi:hypothetical protein
MKTHRLHARIEYDYVDALAAYGHNTSSFGFELGRGTGKSLVA